MKSIRKLNGFVLLRLLGLVLFVYIISKIDFSESWEVFRNAQPFYVVLAILSQIVLLMVKAQRWYLIRKGKDTISWTVSSARFFESYTMGVLTPGRLGEFLKAGHEKNSCDRIYSIIKIFYERGFDLGVFASMSGLFFVYFFADQWPATGWIITFGGIVLLGVTFLLMTHIKFLSQIINLLARFTKITTQITKLTYTEKTGILIFILSVVSNISYFFTAYFLALAVNINETYVTISGIVSVTGILNLLPVTIMGMGTREASFLFFLPDYPSNQIIAFSLLMFLIAQIGGALISLILSRILFVKEKKYQHG